MIPIYAYITYKSPIWKQGALFLCKLEGEYWVIANEPKCYFKFDEPRPPFPLIKRQVVDRSGYSPFIRELWEEAVNEFILTLEP